MEIGTFNVKTFENGNPLRQLPIKRPMKGLNFKYQEQYLEQDQHVGVFNLQNKVHGLNIVNTFENNTFIKIYGHTAGVYKIML